MRQRKTALDRIATLAALRLLAWVGKHIDPAQQLWLDALRAELDVIDGGLARLAWSAGGHSSSGSIGGDPWCMPHTDTVRSC
jgi:hypothetical protein